MRQCVLAAGEGAIRTIVIRGLDDPIRVLGPLLERRSAEPFIRDIVGEVLDGRARPGTVALQLLRYCLEHVRERVTVRDLADSVELSSRTVSTYLNDAEFPSAERLIMFARLLVMAWLRSDPRCSVNRAAALLAMEPSALRHLTAHYLGRSPEGLRGPHGVAAVVRAMHRASDLEPDVPLAGSVTPFPAESLPH